MRIDSADEVHTAVLRIVFELVDQFFALLRRPRPRLDLFLERCLPP
jgi:hypothetical protein